MPRYFFDLFDDIDSVDLEGTDLPDMQAVEAHTLVEAREMMQAAIGEHGKIDLNHCVSVRDVAGNIVHRLSFGDAAKVERGGQPA